MQRYWEEHPFLYQIIQIAREGQWITHVFEWFFMMVSRLAGYLMTIAIGYLIYYAIEFKHGLDAVPVHPQFPDTLASLSNVVINVGPELVFPGVVVMAIRCFTVRRWLDGILYALTSTAFMILTMVLLNAFMNNSITGAFLSAMLFWRAAGALFYTVVVAYCGGHGGLDLRSLFQELDRLREHLNTGQQTVSSLEQQVSSAQQEVSTLHVQLDSKQRELSSVQQEVSTLRVQLDSGQHTINDLQEHVHTNEQEVSTLRVQLAEKESELARLQRLVTEQEQEVSTLHVQLNRKQSVQVSSRQYQLDSGHLDGGQPHATGQGEQKKTGQRRHRLDSGQASLDSRVILLDRTRRHPREQHKEEPAIAGQIRELLLVEPGLSARAIAARVGCSPTTAAKWKAIIEEEQRVQAAECVNE